MWLPRRKRKSEPSNALYILCRNWVKRESEVELAMTPTQLPCLQLQGKETSGLKTELEVFKNGNFLPASDRGFSSLGKYPAPMISSLVTSNNCLKGWVAGLKDHSRIRLPSAAPYGFAGSVAGFQWWLLVSICREIFHSGCTTLPVLIFPNTRNRLKSLLTIAKQCWNGKGLCLIATKKEAPNKK